MNGRIKTYLPEKKYGFIGGDDGKDYFFHVNDFVNPASSETICEETPITFEQKATPKGYRAVRCTVADIAQVSTYVVPEVFMTSKVAPTTALTMAIPPKG